MGNRQDSQQTNGENNSFSAELFLSRLSGRPTMIVIIIIMGICKAPTLRLKALNKHTHIMYIDMENVINKYIFKKSISTSCHT